MRNNCEIFITSPNSRKSFDIFNILNSKGYKTNIVGNFKGFEKKILCKSYDKEIAIREIEDLEYEKKSKYQTNKCIFLTEESDIEKIYKKQLMANDNINFLVPPEESFYVSRNKKEFSRFCENENLPAPKLLKIEDLKKSSKIKIDIVIKPIFGQGSEKVYFYKKNSPTSNLLKIYNNDFIIQEKIGNTNNIIAGCFLYMSGKLINFYSYKRIRTFPPKGGVTVFSKFHYEESVKKIG